MGKFFSVWLVVTFFVTITTMASKLEITAKSLNTIDDTIYADEGVIVYYNDSIIKAKKATYNKKTKLLIFDGEVEMIGYKGTKEYTNHMELQTETEEATFKQLFLAGDNDVWLLTDKAHKKEGTYDLGRSILSSCDVKDPLWKMVFENSLYDGNKKYMKVYNAKVYLGGIPIFYSPYLAFSTNKERSSGVLFPRIGYTPSEGILYEQPIFWAIQDNMDLEINPQIRTKRSYGLYSTFRFVDSNHSSGVIRGGYFSDQESYTEEYQLDNDKHFGFEFNYESSEVFKKYLPEGMTDGLYINTTFLNDIDYLNLQKGNLGHFGLRPRQESRVNYFLYNNEYYAGLNAKYFIDTRSDNNDETLQVLPSLQWHKYLTHLVWDNLTYSVDTHINNVTRKVGSTLKQAEIKIPIEYTTSFFNDFVHLSFSEELYYSKYFFGNGTYENDTFQYYNNTQKASLFTDLTKQYDDVIHVIQPSLEYLNPGNENHTPVDFSSLEQTQKELFSVGLPEESFSFDVKQYLYDENMKLFFSQRLSQKYYPDREYKLSELHNEMQYIWEKWTFYNYLIYSHEYKELAGLSSSIELRESAYRFSLGHSYKQNLAETGHSVVSNDVNFNFAYTYNEKIRLNGGFTYDIDSVTSKQWKVGIGYFRDCWSIDTSIRQDIRPTSAGSEKLNTFYLQLNFIPFGGLGTGDFE